MLPKRQQSKYIRLKCKHEKLVQDDEIASEGPMYGPCIASLPGENQTQKTASKTEKKLPRKNESSYISINGMRLLSANMWEWQSGV